MKEYASGRPLVNVLLQNKKPAQILKTISFISLQDDSFTRGQPPISVTSHWRILKT